MWARPFDPGIIILLCNILCKAKAILPDKEAYLRNRFHIDVDI